MLIAQLFLPEKDIPFVDLQISLCNFQVFQYFNYVHRLIYTRHFFLFLRGFYAQQLPKVFPVAYAAYM